MTSTQNDFSGNYFITPDVPVNFGILINNPSQILSDMVAGGIYFQEHGDNDTIFISAEKYLISIYKSLANQKLMMNFTARMTEISSQQKIRWVHRSLALSMDFTNALKSIGLPATIPDDWSNLTAINQALAPYYIQVHQQLACEFCPG